MNSKQFENIANQFKVLGHPERAAIFSLFCTCGCNSIQVKEIYKTLNLQQAVVSRHLKLMKDAGLVKRINNQGEIHYCPCNESSSVDCIRTCFKKFI